jgi:hypothetical protein
MLGNGMNGIYVVLTLGIFIGLIVGFGGGYGVREIISRRRRAEERARYGNIGTRLIA